MILYTLLQNAMQASPVQALYAFWSIANGTVDEVTLVSSSGNANLDQAGINAAYKWRFTSAVGTNGQRFAAICAYPSPSD